MLAVTLLSAVVVPTVSALAASQRNSLSQTAQAAESNDNSTIQAEKEVFFSSDYTYDDAVALASFWGYSLDETKATIGRKISWGSDNVEILNDNLKDARKKTRNVSEH